jgi:hypothetical protein
MNIPDEAVEAVTEAIEPYVALGKYVPDAARAALSAALSAALPAIERAHLEQLAAQAREEIREAWRRGMEAGIDTPEEAAADADNEHAHHAHRWLSARLDQTKEKP